MLTPKRIYHGIKRRVLRSIQKYQPKIYADYLYYRSFGKHINWEQPEDLNQWINWLAFNTDTSEWTRLADKLAVRSYVEQCGLKHMLVPLLAVWKTPTEISFDSLPPAFVLKVNNGCGDVLIVRDKTKYNIDAVRQYFRKVLAQDFGKDLGEPHYRRIQPCIIAEQLLPAAQQTVKSSSLIDYKIWCINGVPQIVFVCLNRTNETLDLKCYDTHWRQCDYLLKSTPNYKILNSVLPSPNHLDEMLDAAKRLAAPFPQVRVDFYEVNDRVFFGELTFTSASGRMDYFTEDSLRLLAAPICKSDIDHYGRLCSRY